MVRLVRDDGLLGVGRDQPAARDARNGLRLEETTRMEPEEVAL
jgi:hypothetical protein